MMNKFTKILILSIFTIFMIGGFAKSAFAAPLEVNFSSTPLFSEANFAPGNEVVRTVGVANYSGSSQNIIVEAINGIDSDGLGDKLNLVIKEGGTPLYTGTLGAFLSSAGEISLSPLSSGANTTYSFGITFDNSADNNLQNKTLGFDLCVGFQGGETHCGGTTIGEEHGGSSNGGGSSGSLTLIIFNEQALNITNVAGNGEATITWDTNKLATSQVIYGLASETYNLDLNAPHFGYAFSTNEDTTKIIHHSMVLTGLIEGETYKYRVVSRASPATVSYEHEFTVPILATTIAPINNINLANGVQQGEVLGASTENIPVDDETPIGSVLGASVLGSTFNNILSSCYLLALFILIIIYLIWHLWLNKRYKKQGMMKEEIKNKYYLFFGISSTIVILILLILHKYCPFVIFAIILIISACFYTYGKLKNK